LSGQTTMTETTVSATTNANIILLDLLRIGYLCPCSTTVPSLIARSARGSLCAIADV